MRYGDRTLIDHFSATILRGDKVGLIGPNGCRQDHAAQADPGRTRSPPRGGVRQGTKLQVAYFDQMRAGLDLEATLADTISPGSEWVETGNARKHVMSYLTDFLFSPERANSPVRTLSGGERNRLLLARLFALPANVLVLDEPTNDLDIDTLDLLEDLLQSYAGTVFLVSHDRRFLDNVVTSAPSPGKATRRSAAGLGLWREYEGGYEDWKLQRGQCACTGRSGCSACCGAQGGSRRAGPCGTGARESSATRSSASWTRCPAASRRWKPSRRR